TRSNAPSSCVSNYWIIRYSHQRGVCHELAILLERATVAASVNPRPAAEAKTASTSAGARAPGGPEHTQRHATLHLIADHRSRRLDRHRWHERGRHPRPGE